MEQAGGPGQSLFPGDQSAGRREPEKPGRDWPKAAANLIKGRTPRQKVGLVISVLEGLDEIGYTSPVYI